MPDNGFGKVWCDNKLQSKLGWSVQARQASSQSGAAQKFEHGLMLDNPTGIDISGLKRVYVLYDDGTFQNLVDKYPD